MGSVHKHTFTAICPNKLYYRQANEAQQKLFWTCSLFCWTRSTNDVAIHKYFGQLECGPMPNLMVALPNIGGALCSTPQSLADAHY